jgi:hypothetical protein
MVILSLCGDKYNKPSDKPEDMTVLDRLWKRAVARLSQDDAASGTHHIHSASGARTAA